MIRFVLFFICIFQLAWGLPDWSENAVIQANGRNNPYNLSVLEFSRAKTQGELHTQTYPVQVTGLLAPYRPFKNLLGDQFENVLTEVGMVPYPAPEDKGIYSVAYPQGVRPDYPMGFGLQIRKGAQGFTISCAECHAGRLFGKTVLGMTNRFPKANATFVMAKFATHFANPLAFRLATGATDAETKLLTESRRSLKAVGAKDPIVLGLDTSLAQVALSLNKRNDDEYATRNPIFELFPRKDWLDNHPADSKPAVWWNVKYKNRWLADGSVVSGNPIYTNLLWNEIGRGTDLVKLEKWLDENPEVIKELTSRVFASEAPRYTDFFAVSEIDIPAAQRGENIFNTTCSRCHGQYTKAWSAPRENMTSEELIATTYVKYTNKIKDVGTDSYRYLGMKSLEKLNDLTISKKNQILIRPQQGYVAPPLVGIWARWPYFHNNSVPSLCDVLTAAKNRPSVYYALEANDPRMDFDKDCNGYPKMETLSEPQKNKDYKYDTSRKGMSNSGHDEDIFLQDGKELLSSQDKSDLIMFLKTL